MWRRLSKPKAPFFCTMCNIKHTHVIIKLWGRAKNLSSLGFQCNITITNYVISHTYNISWRHSNQKRNTWSAVLCGQENRWYIIQTFSETLSRTPSKARQRLALKNLCTRFMHVSLCVMWPRVSDPIYMYRINYSSSAFSLLNALLSALWKYIYKREITDEKCSKIRAIFLT